MADLSQDHLAFLKKIRSTTSSTDIPRKLHTNNLKRTTSDLSSINANNAYNSTANFSNPYKKSKLDSIKNTNGSGSSVNVIKNKNPSFNSFETNNFNSITTTTEYSSGFLSVKLNEAVDTIKSQDKPVNINSLKKTINFDDIGALLPSLRKMERIRYDSVNNTIEYLSLHQIKTGDDLINYLKNLPTFKGTSVKELKDGWNSCLETIDSLEKQSKIIVQRTKKDNSPRLIWLNQGCSLGMIDEEFVKLWRSVPLPSPADLPKKLVELGQKPTSIDPATIKKVNPASEKKKSKKKKRNIITNTHMIGIFKDFK
ncbi:transcription factor TFIIE subunit TFA2 [Ascoidea rubescens DSM 1968]|uniref:Transcription initiation factor IIE subunit beta n=1 Tax=Ascoidea rubescens DSM 1968 TaxID=1344418 RepID=A0A1D2VIV0_9ASCO|nr:putative transcription factor a small subunit [Ascoidea rubescens DSM 1968]ODV61453.1 putative transcription factor a small subunit [Ascoidea rubescens DSM 1968]